MGKGVPPILTPTVIDYSFMQIADLRELVESGNEDDQSGGNNNEGKVMEKEGGDC